MNRQTLTAFLTGAGLVLLIVLLAAPVPFQSRRTCESVEIENRSLEQCLRHRPTCESVTIQSFIDYYDNENWANKHCSADSGGGFLSQDN